MCAIFELSELLFFVLSLIRPKRKHFGEWRKHVKIERVFCTLLNPCHLLQCSPRVSLPDQKLLLGRGMLFFNKPFWITSDFTSTFANSDFENRQEVLKGETLFPI